MAPQAVLDVCGAVPESRIKGIFTTCMSNNFDALSALGDDLLAEGYPVSQAYNTALGIQLYAHDAHDAYGASYADCASYAHYAYRAQHGCILAVY